MSIEFGLDIILGVVSMNTVRKSISRWIWYAVSFFLLSLGLQYSAETLDISFLVLRGSPLETIITTGISAILFATFMTIFVKDTKATDKEQKKP